MGETLNDTQYISRASSCPYPEYIIKMLASRWEIPLKSKELFDRVNSLTPNEVFQEVLIWEGFGNSSYSIKSWVLDIYGVNLDSISRKV